MLARVAGRGVATGLAQDGGDVERQAPPCRPPQRPVEAASSGDNGELTNYKVNCKIAFLVER